ncbi:MAG: AIR synthase related protein [Candidatus Freyarchaeota archaeon]
MDLEAISSMVRGFKGVERKRSIRRVTSLLAETLDLSGIIIRSFGEDAAVLDVGWEDYLLVAVDSMWHLLVSSDPFFAGYCSVLVNVNDVVAKGGVPLALLDSLSVTNWSDASKIVDGMVFGCKKFSVPVVGGHLNPDAPLPSLSVTVIGRVKKENVVFSDTASPGDRILLAVDLDGRFHDRFPYAWDSTSWKPPEEVKLKLSSMRAVAEAGLATAAKDVSNPGILGTLGMLLEASGVGGVVNVDHIPKPSDVSMERWLCSYPGFGVVLTAEEDKAERCVELFESRGVAASVIGEVTSSGKLVIVDGESEVEVFNFKYDKISGKP